MKLYVVKNRAEVYEDLVGELEITKFQERCFSNMESAKRMIEESVCNLIKTMPKKSLTIKMEEKHDDDAYRFKLRFERHNLGCTESWIYKVEVLEVEDSVRQVICIED